ncbi:hypothetical protein LEP1GSC179_0465 [Leptospira santarosai str. MOR084]|uniref:Uncharacterized protein n=1 Tax=Leptospira santarosai str. MOR084 TaxID=1049984 RepID=A0A0E2BB55_9LEPT|nr:hypothetical protein LEP1GSC179_0465 [Leptospira santarosai str. MOR084]
MKSNGRTLGSCDFLSVPTRMRFFTCKKYDFLIEKNLPKFSRKPATATKIWAGFEKFHGRIVVPPTIYLPIRNLRFDFYFFFEILIDRATKPSRSPRLISIYRLRTINPDSKTSIKIPPR